MIIDGIIEPGYQVASGASSSSPYPEGTIKMQVPFFKERGVDIDKFHPATINVTIKPRTFEILTPDYSLNKVQWTDLHPPENFIFIHLEIKHQDRWCKGLLYYPDPSTKKEHFAVPSRLEILTEFLNGLKYGDKVQVKMASDKIKIID